MRALVVDDDDILAKLLKIRLNKQGYNVDVVFNGKDALKAFNKHNNTKNKYDIAILDHSLPDGFTGEMLSVIFKDKCKSIKCILYTAVGHPIIEYFMDSYGLDAIVHKSDGVDKLVESIEIVTNTINSGVNN